MVKSLTAHQLHAITMIERINSGLSITGCLFIALTFIFSKAFHKPINRLVFYASVGNIMTNVATLISRDAIAHPTGALCQVQGFLIQMFMCADAYWTLAMACNVYLTFFWKYDAEQLRQMEKWYFLACYGIPFIPAFLYLFIKRSGEHVYGNATLWCWVDSEWDIMRIATFYAPVWLVIFITFGIYIRAGKEIYTRRRQLRSFQNQSHPTNAHVDNFSPAEVKNPFASMKTTEVHVTSESAAESNQPIDLARLGRRPTPRDRPLYSVTVSSNAPQRASSLSLSGSSPSPPSHKAERMMGMSMNSPAGPKATLPPMPRSERPRQPRTAAMEANSAAWGYTKVAVLFFTAMLVTWIPSSANRVYSVVHPDQISTPLQFTSAFVLPLQGFWNAVIYVVTSWAAVKHVFGGAWERLLSGKQIFMQDRTEPPPAYAMHGRPQRMGSGKGSETESMTELASRGGSHEEVHWQDAMRK